MLKIRGGCLSSNRKARPPGWPLFVCLPCVQCRAEGRTRDQPQSRVRRRGRLLQKLIMEDGLAN